ncbi:Glycine receptor subunit alpha-3, partial [Araneus ventricosus]
VFSFLNVSFVFLRQNEYHLVQTYLPTFLIVMISWVSFWIPTDPAPARTLIGVTSSLTLATIASGIRSQLPPISYAKAIDVWIGACAVMCFAAFLEFAAASYLKRMKVRHRQPKTHCLAFWRTVQSGGASVVVFGVCSWRDMGPLIRLETTLTGGRYFSILSDHLHSFMSVVHSDGLGQSQQDNVTPHASRVATKWLQEHSYNFRHFHWPPKFPEMNIIEDIWDALLHAVEKRSPPSRTLMDLLTTLQDSWCEFPPRYLQTLVKSMPRRFASLLLTRGARLDIMQVYQFFWLFSVCLCDFDL